MKSIVLRPVNLAKEHHLVSCIIDCTSNHRRCHDLIRFMPDVVMKTTAREFHRKLHDGEAVGKIAKELGYFLPKLNET